MIIPDNQGENNPAAHRHDFRNQILQELNVGMRIVDVLVVVFRSSVKEESRLGIQRGICWRNRRVKHRAFRTKETMERVSKIASSTGGKVDCSPAPSPVTMAR
jgi:hypothetical protein